jgi:hypothetical protein
LGTTTPRVVAALALVHGLSEFESAGAHEVADGQDDGEQAEVHRGDQSEPPTSWAISREAVVTSFVHEGVDLPSLLSVGREASRFGPIAMEQVWNRWGATGGKRSARLRPENGLN